MRGIVLEVRSCGTFEVYEVSGTADAKLVLCLADGLAAVAGESDGVLVVDVTNLRLSDRRAGRALVTSLIDNGAAQSLVLCSRSFGARRLLRSWAGHRGLRVTAGRTEAHAAAVAARPAAAGLRERPMHGERPAVIPAGRLDVAREFLDRHWTPASDRWVVLNRLIGTYECSRQEAEILVAERDALERTRQRGLDTGPVRRQADLLLQRT